MLTLAITDACSDTVKVQNSLSFSDPECTEHRSKVSTPRVDVGGAKILRSGQALQKPGLLLSSVVYFWPSVLMKIY